LEAIDPVRRREVLGAAAGALAGCATLPVDRIEGRERYARLDRNLQSVGGVFEEMVPRARSAERAYVDAALRSLLLTAVIHELPESERGDPRMKERLQAHAKDFELALGTSREILQMPASERLLIERGLRRDPALADRVSELLARKARAAGISGAGRIELRKIAQQSAWSMQHQPISLVMDDTLARMRKVEARLGADATRARLMLAAAQESVVAGEYDEDDELAEESESEEAEAEEIEAKPKKPTRGRNLMIGGGIAMGGGLLLGAAGFGLFFASFDTSSDFAATLSLVMCGVGAIALVIGLIVLIVGIAFSVSDASEYEEAQ
jgi:hypothetical protein